MKTEFMKVLRYGSRKERRRVLKWAGLGSYYKYGTITSPHGPLIKKTQLEIIEYTSRLEILGIIKIYYRLVYILNPNFAYELIYSRKGKLIFMHGGSKDDYRRNH